MNLNKAGKWLLDALLPRACPHCRRDLHYLEAGPLCAACAAQLRPLAAPFCGRCGLPLADGGGACRDCRGGGLAALDLARSALVFNPPLRSLLHAFKYRGRDDLAAYLGGAMAGAAENFPELSQYRFLVPVPLHPSRLRSRGYNQAALLAAAMASGGGYFVLEGAASRARDTASQATLGRADRRSNMEKAFAAGDAAAFKGRKVLIIDDVATTLATLSSLAQTLKAAGAAAVAAYTLAREPWSPA